MNGLLQAIGGATLAAFLLVAFTPVTNLLGPASGARAEWGPADAIVVLGGGIYDDGELSRASLKRTVRGIELYQLGYAPRLVLLGPQEAPGYPSEAEFRRRLATTMRVEPVDIITIEEAYTTREEALAIADRLGPLGVRSILLVSAAHHLVRARRLFENAGFEVLVAPANDYSTFPDSPAARILLMQTILQEQAARLYYTAAGYF